MRWVFWQEFLPQLVVPNFIPFPKSIFQLVVYRSRFERSIFKFSEDRGLFSLSILSNEQIHFNRFKPMISASSCLSVHQVQELVAPDPWVALGRELQPILLRAVVANPDMSCCLLPKSSSNRTSILYNHLNNCRLYFSRMTKSSRRIFPKPPTLIPNDLTYL